ncbi:MAG: DUF4159 domain-containing protein [candidate division WOR-3 bacterium]
MVGRTRLELGALPSVTVLHSAFCVLVVLSGAVALAQTTVGFQIARLEYSGGGDWYNDPDAVPNLCRELGRRTNISTELEEARVKLTDDRLYNYPFLFMTGHGNISFSEEEVKRLRHFLESGGFLYADDDYGMDESFRREMAKVLPQSELVELPFDHPIYHQLYDFDSGPPKIHEHYEGPPRGFGIYLGGRMVVYYTYNSNVSDGWTEAHNDPPDVREQAFRMGVNIVCYFLTN